MRLAEEVYNYSPIPIQNVLVTVYGLKLKIIRYGGEYKKCFKLLKETQYYSADELHNLQSKSFARLIDYACGHVPYYKNVINDVSVNVCDITLDNYRDVFGLLTKEMLRVSHKNIVSKELSYGKPITINTSGTSGTPLKIAAYKNAIQRNYAFFSRVLTWAGVNFGDRSATFAGRVFIPQRQKGPPYWRYNKSLNNLLFSSYNISDKTIPSYIKALDEYAPIYIDSYPSAIYEIARYINDNQVAHSIRPNAIITSSETLHDYQRISIKEAFGCNVYDHLGSAEMVALISQCETGNYHANPEYGLLEVVDQSGNPVVSGEPGQLVCTGLINYAMPLIRYVLGDMVILSDMKCDCGRHFPVIESIVGRTDDLIIACDGSKVGRLDPVFKGLEQSIKETQIIQNSLKKITVKIVKDPGCKSINATHLISEIKKRTGDCMDVCIEYVETIPRTKSGKFRSVVSELEQAQRK